MFNKFPIHDKMEMEVKDNGNKFETCYTGDVGWTCSVNGQSCSEGCDSEFLALVFAYIAVEKALKRDE